VGFSVTLIIFTVSPSAIVTGTGVLAPVVSVHLSGMPAAVAPVRSTWPSRASLGPKGALRPGQFGGVPATCTTFPLASTSMQTSSDSPSLRETCRVASTFLASCFSAFGIMFSGDVVIASLGRSRAEFTTNSITCPVVLGSAGTSGNPPNGASGAVLVIRTRVPSGSPLKSTITSARSASPISSACCGSGAATSGGSVPSPGSGVAKPVSTRTTWRRKPCSAPIW
jgi:hypothetical protein